MTFSLDWDCHYDPNTPAAYAFYPNFEKLLTFFVGEADRMLELGAGAGGEIQYFAGRGFGYHGIDGSEAAIAALKKQYRSIADRIKVADFTKEIPFDGQFDLIVDRASVAHNDLASIRSCIALVYEKLKPGGLFISSDWFSAGHSEARRGIKLEENTRSDYPDGQFQGVGKVHFSSEEEIVDLFKDFEGIFMQERIARRPPPNDLVQQVLNMRWVSPHFRREVYQSAFWDIVVRRPL